MSNFQLNVKINGVEQSVKTVGELEAALKATKEELKGLEVGSEAFETLASQARKLQDELKGSFKEATNFDKSLGQLTESVSRLGSSVAAGFAIATSAIGIFGGEAEDLTKAQVKAQQALAIAFGATTIATNAAKLAGDAKLIVDRLQLGLTNLLTGAFGKETVAKSASAAATGTATVAQRALNAAMAANPVLLLVSALGLLIGAFVAFSGETKKATINQKDFIKELDNSTAAIDREIKRQKELIRIQGQVLENTAANEAERLKIRQKTQVQLNELDLQELDRRRSNLQDELKIYEDALELELAAAKIAISIQSELGDDARQLNIDADTRERIAIIKSYEDKTISAEEYYEALFNLQERNIKNAKFESEEEKKAALETLKKRKEVQFEIDQLQKDRQNKITIQAQQEKISNKEIADAEKKNLDERKNQYTEFNKDVVELTKERAKVLSDLERQFQDFELERISLLTETFEFEGKLFQFTNEDIIKGYDERIKKTEVAKERAIADAEEAFEEEIKRFIEAEKRRVDANGKRVVGDKEINDTVLKLRDDFQKEQLKREEIFNEQIITITNDRANKVQEIEETLVGDNSLLDNRQSLLLEAIDFEIQQAERRIEIERGFSTKVIAERQRLEAEKRRLLEESLKQELQIQTLEALKNVQGTEEQKAKQREEINKIYNERLKRINDDFRSQEEVAEKQTADEINNYKLQKLQEFTQLASQGLSTVVSLFQSFNELAAVERENELRKLRDYTAQQTSILNEGYNQDLLNLESRYAAGILTQEQYNSAIESLNKNLSDSTNKLNDKQKAQELKANKQAFENEKKLKVANAIIAGLQGAVQAYASVASLGPLGPVVGGVLAGLIAATTAANVAAIQKTQFDSGAPSITAANSAGGGGSFGLSGSAGGGLFGRSTAAGGGFTQFSDDLVGTPGSGGGSTGGFIPEVKVVVVESDITDTQRRVRVAETSTTFG